MWEGRASINAELRHIPPLNHTCSVWHVMNGPLVLESRITTLAKEEFLRVREYLCGVASTNILRDSHPVSSAPDGQAFQEEEVLLSSP
jgi:hypothetical protein